MALRILLPLLLLAAALLLLPAEGVDNVASQCCERTSLEVIPSFLVKSYRIQGPESGCRLHAVVFTTRKEKKICSSLTSRAVQKLIRRLEDKQKNPSQKPRRLSFAQQKAKKTPAPKLISDVEYTALKSEIEMLKSSLGFERETGKTLGIRVDQLLNENDELLNKNNKLVAENDKLVAENDKLVAEYDELLNESEELMNENNRLVAENDKLVAENDKLVNENSRLKQLLERFIHLLNKARPSASVKKES
uniref:Chemokine interleukin-8-like domain-containing protein n=1 Tax=Anas platyrhynchos TaxID=8839 RepID=A0A8B9ZLB4_ANAPL